MTQFGIGQPVRRVEDRRFLTGRGHYLDDIVRPRQLHAVMLRSPHAHARIRSIDTTAAAGPGVLAILTGADLAKDGIGTIPCMSGVTNRDKSAMATPPRPAIGAVVGGRVRHVGDTVAMVVAETVAAARDAAERIAVASAPRRRSSRAGRRCGTSIREICASIGRSASAPRPSALPPRHAIGYR